MKLISFVSAVYLLSPLPQFYDVKTKAPNQIHYLCETNFVPLYCLPLGLWTSQFYASMVHILSVTHFALSLEDAFTSLSRLAEQLSLLVLARSVRRRAMPLRSLQTQLFILSATTTGDIRCNNGQCHHHIIIIIFMAPHLVRSPNAYKSYGTHTHTHTHTSGGGRGCQAPKEDFSLFCLFIFQQQKQTNCTRPTPRPQPGPFARERQKQQRFATCRLRHTPRRFT